MSYTLVLCVFGCITIPKYKDQIKKIKETYEQDCGEDVKIIYFLGEEMTDYHEDNFVYLPGVSNDYLSASHKQYLGIKYIHEHYDTKYVLSCGTDTFVNLPKLVLYLKQFNPEDSLYIGGYGDTRIIGDESYYFH